MCVCVCVFQNVLEHSRDGPVIARWKQPRATKNNLFLKVPSEHLGVRQKSLTLCFQKKEALTPPHKNKPMRQTDPKQTKNKIEPKTPKTDYLKKSHFLAFFQRWQKWEVEGGKTKNKGEPQKTSVAVFLHGAFTSKAGHEEFTAVNL